MVRSMKRIIFHEARHYSELSTPLCVKLAILAFQEAATQALPDLLDLLSPCACCPVRWQCMLPLDHVLLATIAASISLCV